MSKALNGAAAVHPHMRQQYQSYDGRGTPGSPQLDGGGRSRGSSVSRPNGSPQLNGHTFLQSMSINGPHGYPPHDGFEFEPDEDEYEDYPTTSHGPGGRDTPQGARRNNAMSLPHPERDHGPHDRARANTEDVGGAIMTQWRSNLPQTPGALRPITPRLSSANSAASYSSDASFGNDTRRPPLRSQFSSSKLKTTYERYCARSGSVLLILPRTREPEIRADEILGGSGFSNSSLFKLCPHYLFENAASQA